jgi:hypothetical protein
VQRVRLRSSPSCSNHSESRRHHLEAQTATWPATKNRQSPSLPITTTQEASVAWAGWSIITRQLPSAAGTSAVRPVLVMGDPSASDPSVIQSGATIMDRLFGLPRSWFDRSRGVRTACLARHSPPSPSRPNADGSDPDASRHHHENDDYSCDTGRRRGAADSVDLLDSNRRPHHRAGDVAPLRRFECLHRCRIPPVHRPDPGRRAATRRGCGPHRWTHGGRRNSGSGAAGISRQPECLRCGRPPWFVPCALPGARLQLAIARPAPGKPPP